MQKAAIIIIGIILVIAVIWGIYFLVTMLNGSNNSTTNTTTPTAPSSTFDIKGMKVTILKQGAGVAAKNGDSVTVNYVGTLADGTKFDSSIDRNAPFTFPLGASRVIQGWDLGVVGMKVGEKRKLVIPPELGYGAAGFLSIPKNATLNFEVDLLKIN